MAECLARDEADWSAAIDELVALHPRHAREIEERFEIIRALRDVEASAVAGGFPDRLGEFELLDRLGGGGMGVVFRARQTSLDRDVAVKLIRPDHAYLSSSRERFRREVEAVAQLRHPGIISIHTVGEEAGLPFFAMELLDGPTLADVLADLSNRAPESLSALDLYHAVVGAEHAQVEVPELFQGTYVEACLGIAQQAAEALAHAHERGILHRDVKPSNIAVRPDGRVVLFDFGLTSSARRDSGSTRVTRAGTLLGTLAYMSPEQVQGTPELDARTDVYSLGVTLYELLTLHLPFGGRNTLQVQSRILAGVADSMRARNRRIPEDAETVCRTAMATRAPDRYASASDLASDLHNVLSRTPIVARPPALSTRVIRWCQRHAAATAALALGALLLFGLPTGLWVQKSVYAGELRRSLDSEKSARATVNAALEGERRARQSADEAVRRERAARVEANDALAREQAARLRANEALELEREAREQAALARDRATEQLRETEDVLGFVVALFQGATPSATRGEERTARDLLDIGSERLGTALQDRPRSHARILQTLGVVYRDLNEHDRAQPLLEEAVELWRGYEDREARANLASTLATLGDVLTWTGKNDAAEEVMRESLSIARDAMDSDDTRLIGILRAFGDALLMRDRAEEALAIRREALERTRAHAAAPPKALAIAIAALGSVHVRLQEPDKAEPLLLESVAIFRRDVGGPDPGFANVLSDLAAVRMGQGRFDEAQSLYEESLEMSRALFADEINHSAMTTRANLAALELYRARAAGSAEQLEMALEGLREAAQGFERMLGRSHPRTLQTYSSVGAVLQELGRYREAVDQDVDLLPEFRSSFGEGDIYTASVHLRLGACRLQLGDAEGAALELERALEIMDPLQNFDPMKVEGHYWMGRAQLALDRPAEAAEHFRRGLAFETIVPQAEYLERIREALTRLSDPSE